MNTTILIAYAPGLGHCNTVLPLAEDFARRTDCTVYLCGSRTVATQAHIDRLPVHHRPSGPDRFLRTNHGEYTADEVIARMGRLSRHDITELIDRIRPHLLVCDTSERGAVLAAIDRDVPFVRIVSCADATTPPASLEEARRRTLIRGHEHNDLRSPLHPGTMAFGPRWFFRDARGGEELGCYQYRPPTTPHATRPANHARPRALVSFGTFVTEPTAAMFENMLHGLLDAGIRSITLKIRDGTTRAVLHRLADQLTTRTGCAITVTAELNLRQHLPDADLLLCHGSATSTLEALHHHTTPIIAPTHTDTYFVARQCAENNTAVVIDWATDFTRKAIRYAAETALHEPRIATGVGTFTSDNGLLPSGARLAASLIKGRTATRSMPQPW